jgi:hypothetical protein
MGVIMTQKGFLHPEFGYFQTMTEPSAATLATYAEGTIEVPLRPSPYAEWVNGAWVDHPAPPPPRDQQEAARQAAYTAEADPLFFKTQRGEATEAQWLAKIDEIKARYPYPEE